MVSSGGIWQSHPPDVDLTFGFGVRIGLVGILLPEPCACAHSAQTQNDAQNDAD